MNDSEFQVHRDAAARKTTRKPRVKRVPAPVIVTKISDETMFVARALAKGRDVHLVLGSGKDAGSVFIVNGREDA